MLILGILVGLLVLSLLVALHELGHAWAALRGGVKVEEYAIGFPPRLWSKKMKSGILFVINALPIGGYVKLKGEYDAANQVGDYGASGYKTKSKILFAGVAMNFLVAIAILTVLATTSGLPMALSNQVHFAQDTIVSSTVRVAVLENGGPAALAGVKKGDELLSLAGRVIKAPQDLSQIAAAEANKLTKVVVRRGQKELSLELKLRSQDKPADKGFIGLYPVQDSFIKTTWFRAPTLAVATTAQFSWETLKGVGQLVKQFFSGVVQKISSNPLVQQEGTKNLNRASSAVAGPIGMLGTIFPALLSSDLTTFCFFVALISLTLAVMNLLPIPGLDGGRWLLMTLFKLFKKPLTKEIEERVQAFGMMLLFGIMILVVISDVGKII